MLISLDAYQLSTNPIWEGGSNDMRLQLLLAYVIMKIEDPTSSWLISLNSLLSIMALQQYSSVFPHVLKGHTNGQTYYQYSWRIIEYVLNW